MQNPIIVALDVPNADAALKLAAQLAPVVGAFKIGSELFTSAGPDIVRKIRATGGSVFLDLKFHDIPNTVAKSVAAAVRLDVQMLTIHTCGGTEMMRAAERSAQETAKELGRPAPLVLGVTVLTSMDALVCTKQVFKQTRLNKWNTLPDWLPVQDCAGWFVRLWKLSPCAKSCLPPCN